MALKGKHIGGIALAGAAAIFLIKKLTDSSEKNESAYKSYDDEVSDSEPEYYNYSSRDEEEYEDDSPSGGWEPEPVRRQPYAPCSFADGISKYDFQQIVKRIIRKNDRLEEIKVFDAKIYGLVRSQTGKSAWRFILDFNDNGHLTGYYQCSTRNDDSQIPIYIGNSIKEVIIQRSVGFGVR